MVCRLAYKNCKEASLKKYKEIETDQLIWLIRKAKVCDEEGPCCHQLLQLSVF